MNKWSIRRRRIALSIVLGFLILIIGIPMYFSLRVTPTCFDNKQNGDEVGVDCGGSCKLLCSAQSLDIQTKGDARVLKVATNTYEVVVSVENPNPSASILKAGYTFKIYSASSTGPIKIIKNYTFVPKASSFAIFEGPFTLLDLVPARAVFEWDKSTIVWENDISVVRDVKAEESVLSNIDKAPRLDSMVKNFSLERVTNIELVAIVLDENDNIIGASKTFVDILLPNESTPIVFNWSSPFMSSSTRPFIFTRILPDASYIR